MFYRFSCLLVYTLHNFYLIECVCLDLHFQSVQQSNLCQIYTKRCHACFSPCTPHFPPYFVECSSTKTGKICMVLLDMGVNGIMWH
jgi:hypothetical protein